MTPENFEKAFMMLVAAKLQAPDPDFIKAKRDVYWTRLREIPDNLWFKGVGYCLDHGTFLPSIEELGTACMGEHYTYNMRTVPTKLDWTEVLREESGRLAYGNAKKLIR